MDRTVAIGIQDFEKLIKNDYFYIDKTDFIRKTLMMSLLDYFFSIRHARRSDLFEKLSIWQNERLRKLQGTYPLISLSFANLIFCIVIMGKKPLFY